MFSCTSIPDIAPKKKQKCVGLWFVGSPGCGKSALISLIVLHWRPRKFFKVDSDDYIFKNDRDKSTEHLAKIMSNKCRELSGSPILASSVEGPPDHDRWIIFGIDQPILDVMKRKPAAYDSWLCGEDMGSRAIDTWKASVKVDYVLRGDLNTMAAVPIKIMEQIWAPST